MLSSTILLALILLVLILIWRRLRTMSQATDRLTASVTKLDADITQLIATGNPAAVAAAVDALATSTANSVDATDAKVVAALTPAP
jgi:hypothetical protein